MATHLTDEVTPEDDLIVLDKGSVVAAGRVEEVIARSGAIDQDAAFNNLTPVTHGAKSGETACTPPQPAAPASPHHGARCATESRGQGQGVYVRVDLGRQRNIKTITQSLTP